MNTPIEQSNLFGTQSLSTPYGSMAIDNSYPTDDTINLLFDQRDRQRASEIYLWALPLTQFQVWTNEQERVYGAKGTDFVIYDRTTYTSKQNVDGTYTVTLSPNGEGQNGIPTGKPFYGILRAYCPVQGANLTVKVEKI
jgi:hypothetical protein